MRKLQGKSFSKTQEAADELAYIMTFNNSISQAMPRIMQDM